MQPIFNRDIVVYISLSLGECEHTIRLNVVVIFTAWGGGTPGLWSQVLFGGGEEGVWEGVSQSGPRTGVPPPGHDKENRVPPPDRTRAGVPPFPHPKQDTPQTGYGAVGTPIAVTQEDFLVWRIRLKKKSSKWIPLSISCPPSMTKAPEPFRFICSQTGETYVNLCPKIFATSYPWLFH